MAFDIQLHIEENSRPGLAIRDIVAEQHVTPQEALDQIIEAGIQHAAPTAIEAGRGLFSSPEDVAALEAAVKLAYEERRQPTR